MLGNIKKRTPFFTNGVRYDITYMYPIQQGSKDNVM